MGTCLTIFASLAARADLDSKSAEDCESLLHSGSRPAAPHVYYDIPRIPERSFHYTPARRANDFLETLSRPVLLNGPPESQAFTRAIVPGGIGGGVILSGGGEHTAELLPGGQILRLKPSMLGFYGGGVFGGVRYNELPNSTLLQSDSGRSFLITRGIPYYTTDVDLNTGSIKVDGYRSDFLLFEIVKGQAIYRKTLLKSEPNSKFFVEDPRISDLTFADGHREVLLSATDYSTHVPGNPEMFVMNRYVRLKFDEHGEPLAPLVGPDGRPEFANLSPAPQLRTDIDGAFGVDAKNGTIALNEFDQVVVRTRLRPDFKLPDIQKLAGDNRWKYGEQIFVFADFEHFLKYNWNHCLEDLFKPNAARNRIAPILAKELIRDSDFHETFNDPRVQKDAGIGGGPGTTAVRYIRRGDALYISKGKHAREHYVGVVPPDFPLQSGQVTYTSFDHEIYRFEDVRGQSTFTKRLYPMVVKQFDESLSKIMAYYSNAVQPLVRHERGYNSGIVDLQHVYPEGWEIIKGVDGRAMIRVSLGESDAHTGMIIVDPIKLLMEMAPGSARWRSGQVYQPIERRAHHSP
jgi:hypothetical protein